MFAKKYERIGKAHFQTGGCTPGLHLLQFNGRINYN